jgi:hypothetical protein
MLISLNARKNTQFKEQKPNQKAGRINFTSGFRDRANFPQTHSMQQFIPSSVGTAAYLYIVRPSSYLGVLPYQQMKGMSSYSA